MNLKGKTVGFGMTGSHCTHDEVLPQMERLVKLGARVIPILSHTVQTVDSKFGEAAEWLRKIRDITDENMITSIPEAEPIGPKKLLDCMVGVEKGGTLTDVSDTVMSVCCDRSRSVTWGIYGGLPS